MEYYTAALANIEWATVIAAGALAGLIVLFCARFIHAAVDNLVAASMLKLKGYRLYETVTIDDQLAHFTRMGAFTTHFMIHNGDNRYEYLAVSNTKLDDYEIRKLVRRYPDDKKGGK